MRFYASASALGEKIREREFRIDHANLLKPGSDKINTWNILNEIEQDLHSDTCLAILSENFRKICSGKNSKVGQINFSEFLERRDF